MAARKANWGGIITLGAIIGLVGWYLLKRKKAAAAGGGASYGGGSGFPSLFRPGGAPAAGGSGIPSGGGGALPNLSSLFHGKTLQQRIAELIGYVRAGNLQAQLLPSSSDYLPGLGVSPDLSIPLQPVNLFDVGQLAQPIPGFDTSLISPTDANLSDLSIPYQPIDTGGIDPNSFLLTQDIQPSSPTPDYSSIDSLYTDPGTLDPGISSYTIDYSSTNESVGQIGGYDYADYTTTAPTF